jgi:hypothetical protein
MKLNRKIWVKKIYSVSDSKYVQIYSGDFHAAKRNRGNNAESSEADIPVYIKAPFWYSGYRYVKSNFARGAKWLMIISVLVAIVVLLKHNIGPIKHFAGDIVQSIFKR